MQEEISKEDTQLLADVGFLALSYGDLDAALTIFKGVEIARPGSEAGPLGTALVDMARGEPGAAAETLRRLPPSDQVQLYLAIALLKSGDKQGADELFEDLTRTATGTPCGEIAAAYLKGEPHDTPIL